MHTITLEYYLKEVAPNEIRDYMRKNPDNISTIGERIPEILSNISANFKTDILKKIIYEVDKTILSLLGHSITLGITGKDIVNNDNIKEVLPILYDYIYPKPTHTLRYYLKNPALNEIRDYMKKNPNNISTIGERIPEILSNISAQIKTNTLETAMYEVDKTILSLLGHSIISAITNKNSLDIKDVLPTIYGYIQP